MNIYNKYSVNYKSKYQNCEFAIYIYFNQEELSVERCVMLANIFHNIKYLHCGYSKELMDMCANYCPKVILDKIPDSIVDAIV